MIVLVGILAFLVGLVVSHHYIVVPLWETESKLRKELRSLRGELWQKDLDISNLRCWVMLDGHYTPESRTVPHRTHSDVLKINSIDDLIEGTKP